MTKKTGGNLVDGTQYSKAWSAVVLLSMILFVASYATGLGNVPWQQGELFSLECLLFYLLIPYQYLYLSLPQSPRNRNFPCNSNQLGWEPPHRIYLPFPHGQDHARRRIRVLRRFMSPWLDLRLGVLPRDSGFEFGGSEDGV